MGISAREGSRWPSAIAVVVVGSIAETSMRKLDTRHDIRHDCADDLLEIVDGH